MSGKAHRKNRGVISAVFFPKPMRALVEPVFRVEAEKLADELAAESQADLVRSFTRRHTFNVITRLLGLPVTDVDRLMRWADQIMGIGSSGCVLRETSDMGRSVNSQGGPRRDPRRAGALNQASRGRTVLAEREPIRASADCASSSSV
jgi:cytochrome P450